jgi:hypothetical protein
MYQAIILIILEILLRVIKTPINLSIIDNVKNIMLNVHELINICVPNKLKNEEK